MIASSFDRIIVIDQLGRHGMTTLCGGVAGPAPHALVALTLST
jgi:hypothetical protein